MNNITFRATIYAYGNAPIIQQYTSVEKAASFFDVSLRTIERAIAGQRNVNGSPSHLLIAGIRSQCSFSQVEFTYVSGRLPIVIDGSGLYDPSYKKKQKKLSYYLTVPNKSTAYSKIKVNVYNDREFIVGEVTGLPQTIRELIDFFPDRLYYLREDDDLFHATVYHLKDIFKLRKTASICFDGLKITFQRMN